MLAENVGKYLRSLRLKEGITQRELASKINVTHQAVSRWENGKSIPDVDTLRMLGEFYGVSLDQILQVKKEEEKKESFMSKHYKKIVGMLIPLLTFTYLYYFMFFNHIMSIIVITLFFSLVLILLMVFLTKRFRLISMILFVVMLFLLGYTQATNRNYYSLNDTGFIEIDSYQYDYESDGEVFFESTMNEYDEMIVIQYEDHEDWINIYNLGMEFEDMMTSYTLEGKSVIDVEVVRGNVYVLVSFDNDGQENFELLEMDYTDGTTKMLMSDTYFMKIFHGSSLFVYLERDRSMYSYIEEEEWFAYETSFLVDVVDMKQTSTGYVAIFTENGVFNAFRLNTAYEVEHQYFEQDLSSYPYLDNDGFQIYIEYHNNNDQTAHVYKLGDTSYEEYELDGDSSYHSVNGAYNIIGGDLYLHEDKISDYVYLDTEFNPHNARIAFPEIEGNIFVFQHRDVIEVEYWNSEATFIIQDTYRLIGYGIALAITGIALLISRKKGVKTV